jgi:methylmalonyl-CoA mutase
VKVFDNNRRRGDWMSELTLASDFPEADEEQWRRLVDKVLAGRDFTRALVSHTRDGIPVGPLYGQREQGQVLGARASGWTVLQRVDHPDPAEANRLAVADLEGGCDGLELILPGSIRAEGFGVGVETLAQFDRVLQGIDLARTPLRVEAGYEIRHALAFIIAIAEMRGIDPGALDIVGTIDPACGLISEGRLTASYERISERAADLLHAVLDRGLRMAPFSMDGRCVHGIGGSEVQELAYVVSDGVEHLRQLEARGIDLEVAAGAVAFAFAADVDQFSTIAKLRAFRLLWSRVCDACGLPGATPRIHAQTAWRMFTRYDPWVNILRSAVATAAAGLGGADTVTVLPFSLPLGLPDEFARRVARNTQLVLLEESRLGRVCDPGAGAGYVETLTRDMAEAAWEQFREIEREGGLIASIRTGALQGRIAAVRDARLADIATRVEPITGVTEFALLDEMPVRTLSPEVETVRQAGRRLDLPLPDRGQRFNAKIAALREGATFADLVASTQGEWMRAEALPVTRLSAPFEDLRDASRAASLESGRHPAVFLATLGSLAASAPRSGFARNGFAAGGIWAKGGKVYGDPDDLVREFRKSLARIACICGTDADYAEHAKTVASALKKSGAEWICLAGKPGPAEADLRAAGVDAFIYAGCDILSVLKVAHARLGLAPQDGRQWSAPHR